MEGEEEVGRGSLDALIAADPDLVRADLVVVADVGNVAEGVPTLTTSLRGMTALEVLVETLEAPVHSGMYGGAAPDALLALTRMLATLVDAAGDMAVPGLERDRWQGAGYPRSASAPTPACWTAWACWAAATWASACGRGPR